MWHMCMHHIKIKRSNNAFHKGNVSQLNKPTHPSLNKMDNPYKRLQSQGQGHVKNGLPL